jgi:hypothetical protein
VNAQKQFQQLESAPDQNQKRNEVIAEPTAARKPFVEPVISLPVDVLEATAFFMAGTVTGGGLTP